MDYVDYVKETQDVCSPKAVTPHLNIVSVPLASTAHCISLYNTNETFSDKKAKGEM